MGSELSGGLRGVNTRIYFAHSTSKKNESEPNEGTAVGNLFSNAIVKILREVGHKSGVTVDVVAKEGENYTHTSKESSYKGVVGKDCSYVRLTPSPEKNLADFWKEVNARSAPPQDLKTNLKK